MIEARLDISRLCGETSKLQKWAESQHHEHKYLLEMLERKGLFTGRSPVLVVRPMATNVERRMRAHLTWQFNRVCVAYAAQHTKWTDELGVVTC